MERGTMSLSHKMACIVAVCSRSVTKTILDLARTVCKYPRTQKLSPCSSGFKSFTLRYQNHSIDIVSRYLKEFVTQKQRLKMLKTTSSSYQKAHKSILKQVNVTFLKSAVLSKVSSALSTKEAGKNA
ncbi:hypothetical protein PsorP6_000115 [Peronosclerospora sorghi]|uniref:Uncharacterized protein n=1 Tax=Peronosclerospora sorghi TaxID=230839 RepID=A0ACC0WS12_9STRA|nr:hypothetical protein PsorP6_000115 [Peronosclerospora sorghi]